MSKTRHSTDKPAHTPGGEGVPPFIQSSVKLLRPEDAWQPRMGAPRGNRNAAKPLSTLKARIRDFKRRIRAALKAVD
ncbi:MAG: hypothetical protein JWP16_1972 [Alphaproteobacteria bacterium]|nr:hypothetical protein [Alphaproteobacteria bacterium]